MSAAPALILAPRPAFLDDPALAAVLAALPEARIVGGAVRDALAGAAVTDIDLATPRRPEAVIAALAAAGIKPVPTGLAHGTVTAVTDGKSFEITTLRRDVETDGRHARVAFTDDWHADAARRDFTINAMSMDRTGAVFDAFGGIADLRAGRLCFVGDPAARLAEDWLRALRYFRFYARHARLPPDAATEAALRGSRLDGLSAERVWSELKRILAATDPRPALALMERFGLLARALPEGRDPARLARLIEAGAPPDPLLRLAALLDGDTAALATRLRLARAERAYLLALRTPPPPRPGDDEDTLRRRLADQPHAVLLGRAWLAEAADGGDPAGWAGLRARLAALPRPVFPLAGRDALAAGYAAGPQVGRALASVRAWWLEGGCRADAAACRAELARSRAG